MSGVGAVTGLRSEADILLSAAKSQNCAHLLHVAAAGGRADRARDLALSMARDSAAGLLSFGIAGGLDAALPPGSVLLPRSVIDLTGQVFDVDAAWRANARATLSTLNPKEIDRILGSDRPLVTTADKTELARIHGAAAVDMESHGLARAAAEAKLPLLIVRTVADPANRSIPASAMVGMGSEGETRVLPVLFALARRPADLPGLLRVARDARDATSALGRVAALGLPALLRL